MLRCIAACNLLEQWHFYVARTLGTLTIFDCVLSLTWVFLASLVSLHHLHTHLQFTRCTLHPCTCHRPYAPPHGFPFDFQFLHGIFCSFIVQLMNLARFDFAACTSQLQCNWHRSNIHAQSRSLTVSASQEPREWFNSRDDSQCPGTRSSTQIHCSVRCNDRASETGDAVTEDSDSSHNDHEDPGMVRE